MKQKIYIPQPIAAAGEDYLIEKGYEIVRGSGKTDKESIKNDIAVCDAMIQRTAKVDKEILEAGKNLKIIARHGAGYESHFLCAASGRERYSRVYRNRVLGRTFANIGLYQSACAGRRKEPGNYFKKRVCHDEEIRFPDSSFQRRCC